jgi:hypothetical protein
LIMACGITRTHDSVVFAGSEMNKAISSPASCEVSVVSFVLRFGTLSLGFQCL